MEFANNLTQEYVKLDWNFRYLLTAYINMDVVYFEIINYRN